MMNTAINLLSVIPMRKEPSHRSEMVSQLLFGEYAEILEKEEQFVRVKCLYDDYEGWVQANQIFGVGEVSYTDTYIGNWSEQVLVNDRYVHVPMCSPVYHATGNIVDLKTAEIRYLSSDAKYWSTRDTSFTRYLLETLYQKFVDTPYLWGGKSVFGIDCSGFVQQIFKMFGVKLLRDAYLQAGQGFSVEGFKETKLGDLAFFHNEKGKITHVGIILENHQIVHASGKVRIDTIDENGIVNNETGERTHQLHSMRRYF